VAGTPHQVRDRLAALLADARIQRLVVSPQIGAPGTRITRDFIELFADEILRHD
jgi:alkanesulfonate monooxygenase SsuD/methylene tetrahydromethanopterin reductase-like flavin-dependent oxidoreductase (luciferase family)